MNKWNFNNAIQLEEGEIRIRDPIEWIADKCVNPIIHFLLKELFNINYYKKTNSGNKNMYCDFMLLEWAPKSLGDIRKIDSNGFLLPISLYAYVVSIGMYGKTIFYQ